MPPTIRPPIHAAIHAPLHPSTHLSLQTPIHPLIIIIVTLVAILNGRHDHAHAAKELGVQQCVFGSCAALQDWSLEIVSMVIASMQQYGLEGYSSLL